MKKKEELKRRYNKDRKKIDELLLRKKQISDLISRKRTQLKVMSV